jgi:hypothetical protein
MLTVCRHHLPATMVGSLSCRQMKNKNENKFKKKYTETKIG